MTRPWQHSPPSDRWNLSVVCTCFVLSGLAALVYQTAWTRQFALVFGTSEAAVAAVLAAYMGGLALGAWLIERRIRSHPPAGAVVRRMEAGIAVAALGCVPLCLWLAEAVAGRHASAGSRRRPPPHLAGTSLFYLRRGAWSRCWCRRR